MCVYTLPTIHCVSIYTYSIDRYIMPTYSPKKLILYDVKINV